MLKIPVQPPNYPISVRKKMAQHGRKGGYTPCNPADIAMNKGLTPLTIWLLVRPALFSSGIAPGGSGEAGVKICV